MITEKQKYLLVVAHAPSENTLLMRNKVIIGATASNTERVIVTCSSPFETTPVEVKKADGIILGKVTLLNNKKLNLGVSVFIYVTLKNHDGDSLTDFENAVQNIDEIVECHTTSGEKDYLLKVIVESIEEYEFLLKTKLTHLPLVDHLSSTFALKQVKNTTELPIKRQ